MDTVMTEFVVMLQWPLLWETSQVHKT